MEIFQDYAYYYNSFYKDKDYNEEARQIDNLLKKYGTNICKIINYGCGTGKHDIELSQMGYQCTGIDISPLMIEIAQENMKANGQRIVFSVADARGYNPQEKYDAVISLFHVMSYQNENQDILDAFISARKALNQGGLFLFDVWYGPGVLSDKPEVRVKKVADEKYELIRIANPTMNDKKNVVDVNYEVLIIDKETSNVKKINETHSMRYFFRPELTFLLEKAGFEIITNLDCKTLEETNYSSWTSYFIARAI